MFVLHVGIKVKTGQEQATEKDYQGPFTKAISTQEGFVSASMLRSLDGNDDYLLSLAFENQSLQQKWVATELHGQIWPMMESHFVSYSVKNYTAV